MKKKFSSLFFKYITLFVSILLVTNVIASAVSIYFFTIGETPPFTQQGQLPINFALRIGIMSLIVGTTFIFIATKIVVKPIKDLTNASKKVASGDFTVSVIKKHKGVDEITELTDNFNLMVKELSVNQILHKDFVSNVSHEFKTPISAISGYAEMLLSENISDEDRVKYAEIIFNQSRRLSRLSTDMLKLSELENQSFSLKKESFKLDILVRDAIILFQNEWESKRLEMNVDMEETQISGDKNLIYQMVLNILSNSIKYTDSGSISVFLKDNILKIEDTGIGMDEEQVNHIFDRFYKADKSRTESGTGIGLSIVRQIAKLHNIEITVNSKEGQGTEFLLCF